MHRAAIDAWVADTLTTVPLRAEGKVRLPALLTPPVPDRCATSKSRSPSTRTCERRDDRKHPAFRPVRAPHRRAVPDLPVEG